MKALIAAIATTFALAAGAQTPAPAPDKAAETKAKQDMVKSATEDKGHTNRAAEGSAKAAKTKNTPKALPDTAAKSQAVQTTTGSTAGKGYGQSAAEGSAKAAADKSPRKEPPKMGEHEKQLQKAATP